MNRTDAVLANVDHAIAEADRVQLRYTIDTLQIDLTAMMWMYNDKRIITEPECKLLITDSKEDVYSIATMHTGATAYCDKLVVYLERFGTHMPVPLRKALLYQVYDL